MLPARILVLSARTSVERRARLEKQLSGSPIPVEFLDAVLGSDLTDRDVREWLSDEGYKLHRARETGYTEGNTKNCVGLIKTFFRAFDSVDALQQPVLILEDDAVICDQFFERLGEAISHTPAEADLIYCSWNTHDWVATDPTRHPDVQQIVRRLHGTGAIIFSPRVVPLIRTLKPFDRQIDHDIPDKLILKGRVTAYRIWSRAQRLVVNDNLGGTTTQI